MNYGIGDTVIYLPFCGPEREVKVQEKDEDIKNGRPGFAGQMPDGAAVWGYDSQVVAVRRVS